MSFLDSINEDGFFFTITYYFLKIASYGIIDWFLFGICIFLLSMFFLILFFQRAYIVHYFTFNFSNFKFFLLDFCYQKYREISSLGAIYWHIIKKNLGFIYENKELLIVFIIIVVVIIAFVVYLFSSLGPQIAEQRLADRFNETINNTINNS